MPCILAVVSSRRVWRREDDTQHPRGHMEIAGYVRVSSRRQRDESDSPENQEALLRSAGCTRIYRDLAVSGFSYKQRRRAVDFIRLLEDIRSGAIGKLKTTRVDRIARRDEIFQEILKACEDHSVPFEALASGAIDTKTPASWLNVKMQIVMAEFYSRQLSQSIRTARQSLLARGVPLRQSSSLPFHLMREPGTKFGVIPGPKFDEARQAVLRITKGELSLNQASDLLGISGHAASRWIRRKNLCGHMVDGKNNIMIRDCWPALVNEQEHEAAMAMIHSRRPRWGVNARREPHSLSGIVYCAKCGRMMVYATTGTRQYLRCSGARVCALSTRTVPSHVVETQLVVDHLLPHMSTLAAQLAQPVAAAPPELTEWKRELRYREATPSEYLLPHDRERILELQGLIASASAIQNPNHDAEYARILLSLTDVTLGAGSWFSRPEPDRNRDLRVLVSRVSYQVLMRRIERVDLRVPN